MKWFWGAAGLVFVASVAGAGDLQWNGYYRAEGVSIQGSEAQYPRLVKAYVLHHLVLNPTIVAADGWTIRSRFDVLNNGGYPNSQLGQFIGNGPRAGAIDTAGANATDQYNSLAGNQGADTIAVNELYLTYQHEYGSLLVGRAPLDFGLGMTYNSGRDPFAHWLSNRDMVGYKVLFGNFFLMPMYGKVSEGNIDHEDDINDYMMRLQYDNPDNGLSLGVFFAQRIGTRAGNDTPVTNGVIGGDQAFSDQMTSLSQRSINVFFKREFKTFVGAVEFGMVDARSTGVRRPGELDVTRNGFGVATDFIYRPEDANYKWGMKLGMATGDNGNTPDRFESFAFHRNFDVGELMFNHVLGRGDFLTTQYQRPRQIGLDKKQNASAFVDVESVSNAFYISPSVDRRLTDAWGLQGRFVYALLNQGAWRDIERNQTELLSREFGYEVDLSIRYKPYENVSWVTTAAFLWPGPAFTGGSANYQRAFIDGYTTKLAIQF